jgi:hypothetical protein
LSNGPGKFPGMTAPRIPPHRPAIAAVDAVLSADSFAADAVESFADREAYADVASRLAEIVAARSCIIKALLESEASFAAYRFAVRFGVIPSHVDLDRTYTADDLRTNGTPQAKLALIALGHGRDWAGMDRRERAVFTLRHVVNRMRNRR